MQKRISSQQVKQTVHHHLENYHPQSLNVRHLSGLTNQTFRVDCEGHQTVVFRKFSQLYDRKIDNQIYKHLEAAKIAPGCIFASEQYRIEKFIQNSSHPTLQQLRDSKLRQQILQQLYRFHQSQVPILLDQPLFIEKVLSVEYLQKLKARKNISNAPQFNELYKQVLNEFKYMDQLKQNFLERNPQQARVKIRFCHNDLNNLNIFTSPSVVLIDYDYAAYNYLAYDIANFLNESTINYCVDAFPFFKNQRNISYEEIQQAAKLYPDYYEGLQADIIKGLVFCNLYWAAWSIQMAYDPTHSNFGTVQHGKMRMRLYRHYSQML